jgi:dimeric dUTPase (all-alpha-NTP-PPase superfamily)
MKTEDKLDIIMKLQDSLNAKVGLSQKDAMKLPLNERMKWIRKYLQALIVEIAEVFEETGFKWWKTKEVDEKALQEEIVDAFHFLFSVALLSGMDSNKLFEAYVKKNQKNFVRKDWDVNKEG